MDLKNRRLSSITPASFDHTCVQKLLRLLDKLVYADKYHHWAYWNTDSGKMCINRKKVSEIDEAISRTIRIT